MAKQPLVTLVGSFSFRPPEPGPDDLVRIYPFKRSLAGSLVLLGFLGVFCIPYFDMNWFGGDMQADLFWLVINLFQIFFLMGWSVGVAFLALMFLGSVLGQERVIISPGQLTVRMEILGIGFSQDFPGDEISHLKRIEPVAGSSTAWRGPYMYFMYKGRNIEFGSRIDRRTAELLIELLDERVVGIAPPDTAPELADAETDRDTNGGLGYADVLEQQPYPTATSAVALVIANLVPIAGVMFFDWSVGDVMLLYWGESAIIGIFNVARMFVVDRTATLFLGPFFVGHFGGFMIGHLLFIYGFMVEGGDPGSSLLQVAGDFVVLLPAFVALFASHGLSFVINFLGRREYRNLKARDLMTAPYRRIIVMHLTLIFGGFLVMMLESPVPALILMIGLKVIVDVRTHLAEHREDAT